MSAGWVLRRTERNLWTVGYWAPDGEWEPLEDYNTPEEAAERVHYLNGGGEAREGELEELGELRGRLDALEERVPRSFPSTKAVVRNKRDIRSLRSSLEARTERMYERLRERLEALETRDAQGSARDARLEDRVTALEDESVASGPWATVAELEDNVKDLLPRVRSLEAAGEDTLGRLERLEGDRAELRGRLERVQDQLNKVRARVPGVPRGTP